MFGNKRLMSVLEQLEDKIDDIDDCVVAHEREMKALLKRLDQIEKSLAKLESKGFAPKKHPAKKAKK